MIKDIIEYCNAKLMMTGYFERMFGLSEIISVNNEPSSAKEYIGDGEFINVADFDSYNGSGYWRKTGDTKFNSQPDNLNGIKKLVEMRIPLRLVCAIKRNRFQNDDSGTTSRVANTLVRFISDNSQSLKSALQVRRIDFAMESFSDSVDEIFKNEFGQGSNFNLEYIYLAVSVEVTVIGTDRCFPVDCYAYAFNDCEFINKLVSDQNKLDCILPSFDFSQSSVVDHLTAKQQLDLQNALCSSSGVPVTNSDLSYSTTAISPGLVLPDISVTLKNSANTTIGSSTQPSVKDLTLSVIDTPIKNSSGTLIVNHPSGGDYTVANDSVRNSDSTYVANDVVQGVQKVLPDVTLDVKNSENTTLATSTIPSVKNHTFNLTDINLDFSAFADLVAIAAGKDITITTNVIEYTTPGVTAYNPPANLWFAYGLCIGGGGGGGSGRKGAAGSNRGGGAGASSGTLARRLIKKSEFGAGLNITVGAGGIGGAAKTTNSTNGNAGTAGGSSSIGTLIVAPGGNGGPGGTTGTITGGAGVSVSSMTPNYTECSLPAVIGGGAGTGNGTAGSAQSFAITGGPGGGGITSANAQGNGAAGSTIRKNDGTLSTAATAGVAATPVSAGNGLDNQLTILTPFYPPLNTVGLGTSGGGGYGNRANSGSENWGGGNGGLYGGAGGGGGAGEDDATDSGKGGDGGQGCCLIIEFLIS